MQAGHTYHFRLLAANANDSNGQIHEPETGADFAFGPPLIESAGATGVAATSAELQAVVDPQNVDTRVRVEYGIQPGVYEHSTPEAEVGSAGSGESVLFRLSGLVPNTTYHYRVVAQSALAQGTQAVLGPERSLTTQRAGSESIFALPDQRGWELVSPPNKHGADLTPLNEISTLQAAADGTAITYEATAPTESQPSGNTNKTQVLSPAALRRLGIGADISAPHAATTGSTSLGSGFEYHFFSTPDLSQAILQPLGAFEPALSSEAAQQTPFLRADFPAGEPGAFCAASCYRPLLSTANTPKGVEFGEDSKCTPAHPGSKQIVECGPEFLGASPEIAHVVRASIAPLTPGAPAGESGEFIRRPILYEWSAEHPPAEQLALLGVRPNGTPVPASAEPWLGTFKGQQRARNAVSADGSRAVFSERAGNRHLYLRYNATALQSEVSTGRCTEPELACTLQLDRKTSGSGTGPVEPVFQTASADDSRIFFTDTERLTAGAGAEAGKPDLYECKIASGEEGELECELTDVTPLSGAEPAAVPGTVPGVSQDGSYLYFFANGVLTGAQESEHHEKAQSGQPNLYLSHAGHTTFIATLSGEDSNDWNEVPAGNTSRVSPDGRWLAFMSDRSLTGYDNHDALTGEPNEEVYLYHAPVGEGEAGRLICASCNPTGARPHGVDYLNDASRLVSWNLSFNGPVAGSVPGWPSVSDEIGSPYQTRYLSNGGRLFFNSSDALVPSDTNGTEDVYQYEPPQGEGAPATDTCTESSPTYVPVSGGCVDLISSGTSPAESAFLDASEGGSDVFFLSKAQLSRRDADTAFDIYDARSGAWRKRTGETGGMPGRRLSGLRGSSERSDPRLPHLPGPGQSHSAARGRAGTQSKKDGQMRQGKEAEPQQMRQAEVQESQGKEGEASQPQAEGTPMTDQRAKNKRLPIVLALSVALLFLSLPGSVASAGAETCSTCKPWWLLSSGSRPGTLPTQPGETGEVFVIAENAGDASVDGAASPVTIADTLPPGLEATAIGAAAPNPQGDPHQRSTVPCSPDLAALSCTFSGEGAPQHPLAPYDLLEVRIAVRVKPAGVHSGEENHVAISGGGAPAAQLSRPLRFAVTPGEATPFAAEDFRVGYEEADGAPDVRAGSHPFQFSTTIAINQGPAPEPVTAEWPESFPTALTKDVVTKFPPGFIGDPTKIPTCSLAQFLTNVGGGIANACPAQSAIGVASVSLNEPTLIGSVNFTENIALQPRTGLRRAGSLRLLRRDCSRARHPRRLGAQRPGRRRRSRPVRRLRHRHRLGQHQPDHRSDERSRHHVGRPRRSPPRPGAWLELNYKVLGKQCLRRRRPVQLPPRTPSAGLHHDAHRVQRPDAGIPRSGSLGQTGRLQRFAALGTAAGPGRLQPGPVHPDDSRGTDRGQRRLAERPRLQCELSRRRQQQPRRSQRVAREEHARDAARRVHDQPLGRPRTGWLHGGGLRAGDGRIAPWRGLSQRIEARHRGNRNAGVEADDSRFDLHCPTV